jgi:hypothetical protein
MQPNPPKTTRNAKARTKAQNQPVYISGIQGQHSLETGVAYHYRGHYIYACPAGNPIEPVPFSTKNGINIIGTVRYLAPRYDAHARGLVHEESVGALSKACWQEEKRMEDAKAVLEEQADGEDDAAAVMQMPTVVRSGAHEVRSLPGEVAMSYSMPLVPTQVASRMGSRGHSYTDLAYLTVLDARSRPGDSATSHSVIFQSRASSQADLPSIVAGDEGFHVNRFSGRAVTPTLHRSLSRPGSSASMAAHDSHAGYATSSSATIPGLGYSSSHQDAHVSYSSLTTLARDHAAAHTPHDRALFLADSAPGSRLATPHASRSVSPNHLYPRAASTLRQVASTTRLTQLLAEDRMPRPFSPLSDVVEGKPTFSATTSRGFADTDTNPFSEEPSSGFNETASPPYSRNKPIGTGRPRRASMALNQHYNAVKEGSRAVVSARLPVCVLHGEECDGVSVAETWKTQHAKQTTGFKELFPVVQGAGDRVMVDWHRLLREEQMAMVG